MLLGNTSQEILRGQGFRPLIPARCTEVKAVPATLRRLVEPWTLAR
jgi:hypothetical protein